MAHPNRLANAHVLVLGGTSGIGFAIASMALSHGALVTISGSTQAKLDTKASLLRSLYPSLPASHVAGFACDLADQDHLESNLKELFEQVTVGGSKQIDHIAFTAGDNLPLTKVADASVAAALPGFTVRYLAPLLIAKFLTTGRYMPASASSSLTLTGGTNTHRPMPGWSLVAGIGAAVEGLARGLAVDLAPIRVNAVLPGAIHTELFQGLLDKSSPEAIEKMKNGFSLVKAFGRPEDVAEAYGWLMRDRFASGAMVQSDGGRLLVGTEG